MKSITKERLTRRHRRVRAKIMGTAERPRLSVSRSSKHILVQLIDDERGVTLASASDLSIKKKAAKAEKAEMVGKEIAKLAKEQRVASVVFDRGGFRYHGRVKALADAARNGGLKF